MDVFRPAGPWLSRSASIYTCLQVTVLPFACKSHILIDGRIGIATKARITIYARGMENC